MDIDALTERRRRNAEKQQKCRALKRQRDTEEQAAECKRKKAENQQKYREAKNSTTEVFLCSILYMLILDKHGIYAICLCIKLFVTKIIHFHKLLISGKADSTDTTHQTSKDQQPVIRGVSGIQEGKMAGQLEKDIGKTQRRQGNKKLQCETTRSFIARQSLSCFEEKTVETLKIGSMNHTCKECGALLFKGEKTEVVYVVHMDLSNFLLLKNFLKN